jgi:mono/diheme cytochrome c family protein
MESPGYLATVIGGWMDPAWDGKDLVAARSYARVPGITAPGPGQKLFREKCAACHARRSESVGPDLAGVVARRGEAWLTRWIEAPEALAREGDPVARELRARPGAVRMPNLGLSAAEARQIVEFMKAAETSTAATASAVPAGEAAR